MNIREEIEDEEYLKWEMKQKGYLKDKILIAVILIAILIFAVAVI